MNFYNEHDPKAAAWLRELIRAGAIPPGDVDERSIADIQPGDLAGYTQCHFFAGIGGWSLALDLAGWPADRPVWTGSCPCQPFSTAGQGRGQDDERHLWPAFARLIGQCRPPVIFGEQVESAIGHGWLDGVCDDLERDIDPYSAGWLEHADTPGRGEQCRPIPVAEEHVAAERAGGGGGFGSWGDFDVLPCLDGKARRVASGTFPLAHGVPGRVGLLRGYGNAIVPQVAAEFIEAFLEVEAADLRPLTSAL